MTTGAARVRDEAQAVAPVPSPCINVCRMNPSTRLCEGCLRTIEEIANWSSFDDAAKRAVWDEIEQRHADFMAQQRDARGTKT